jgi:hypothetical protein
LNCNTQNLSKIQNKTHSVSFCQSTIHFNFHFVYRPAHCSLPKKKKL